MPEKQIILASASPRRRELLESIGLEFEILSPEVDERVPRHIEPEEAAKLLAQRKAETAADMLIQKCLQNTSTQEFGRQAINRFLIAADTIVVLDGVIYGKPLDDADAIHTLARLSRRTHKVITGVCVLKLKINATGTRVIGATPTLAGSSVSKRALFAESTDVTFWALSASQIETYVATGEPLDKAGSYGIQERGALLVKEIRGDYFNVVGLPISRLLQEVPELLG
jgi:septum formation protein